jgi:pilus assembly protein CpaF
MFRRMRDSKGEAANKEPAVVLVATEEAEPAPRAAPSNAGELLTSRIKLQTSPKSATIATEVDADAKRRRRLLNLRVDLHRKLLETLNLSAIEKVSENELRSEISVIAREELATSDLVLSRAELDQLVKDLISEVTGLGPLEPLLADPSITDILVNTFSQCYVERGGKLELSPVQFKDNAHLMRVINKIVSSRSPSTNSSPARPSPRRWRCSCMPACGPA